MLPICTRCCEDHHIQHCNYANVWKHKTFLLMSSLLVTFWNLKCIMHTERWLIMHTQHRGKVRHCLIQQRVQNDGQSSCHRAEEPCFKTRPTWVGTRCARDPALKQNNQPVFSVINSIFICFPFHDSFTASNRIETFLLSDPFPGAVCLWWSFWFVADLGKEPFRINSS